MKFSYFWPENQKFFLEEATFDPFKSDITTAVSFHAGDVNNEIIDLVFSFDFYESAEYANAIDFDTSKVAVGNTMYAKTSVVFFTKKNENKKNKH